VFLTYTPGVNKFFGMCGMGGWAWLRTFVCMVIIFIIAEVEKALVDPVLAPLYRPVLAWCERVTPKWLQTDAARASEDARRAGDHPHGPVVPGHHADQSGEGAKGGAEMVAAAPGDAAGHVARRSAREIKKDTAFGQGPEGSRV
jgi:hypothetical protein